ncbi:MAG: hypothetical protein ABJG42_15195 [Vibrio splendidus]
MAFFKAGDVVTSIFSGYEWMNVQKQTNEDFIEEQCEISDDGNVQNRYRE